jgi:ketosteroid isomerase-like protein
MTTRKKAHRPIPAADEAEIRAVIEAIARAVRAKDVTGMLAHCAAEIATFDMVPPIVHEGAYSIGRLWDETLAPFDPPLEYEVTDLQIAVGGDVAFSRSLNRFGGTREGVRTANWLRSTCGFRRIDGRWMLVHEHVSVPFDMETGKALLDLEPVASRRLRDRQSGSGGGSRADAECGRVE